MTEEGSIPIQSQNYKNSQYQSSPICTKFCKDQGIWSCSVLTFPLLMKIDRRKKVVWVGRGPEQQHLLEVSAAAAQKKQKKTKKTGNNTPKWLILISSVF